MEPRHEQREQQLDSARRPIVGKGGEWEANGRLYTVSQAAAILHLAEAWIYERTRKKAIPHRKLGKHIRFTDSDLSAIVQMGFRGPGEEKGADLGND